MVTSRQGLRVLVVGPGGTGTTDISASIGRAGAQVVHLGSTEEAVDLLDASDEVVDVVFVEVGPGGEGLALCRTAWSDYGVPAIVVARHESLDVSVAALRAGACDLLVAPLDREAIERALERAAHHLEADAARVHRLPGAEGEVTFPTIVGSSPRVRELVRRLARVARSDANVLITGESGTGKELIARAIHAAGLRPDGPFVAVNCAAVPGEILEAELFGHVRGAFTGATEARRGLFLDAQGGTLMLDEVGAMPIELQASLLRVLQERAVRRIGAPAEERIDVRIVAATNSDLDERARAGTFRADLLFRLDVLRVEAPPLRERGHDVVELAEHFLRRAAARRGAPAPTLGEDVVAALLAHDWPGNVRELENCIEAAVALAAAGQITLDDLPATVRSRRRMPSVSPESLESLQAEHIEGVLEAVGGNVARAARVLGIDRGTLYRRLRRRVVGGPRRERP